MKSPKRRTKKLLAITALLLLGSAFGVYAYIIGFHAIRHGQVIFCATAGGSDFTLCGETPAPLL